ncbi:3-deoxy-D-manno-octulosonic acid transferase [Paracoccus beibuensis]|uniref:3-deoxy-D-manno-octulosonic acid transferase n=1 Tax=Paracoccus beibuensis TaxID=547602 RepID=UPI00223F6FB7|nr:glycosyltransferase N-terminal domain-containing protein [Paracoccus beibuensis]
MAAGTGLGQLGLWLHLRGRRGDGLDLPAIPAGPGPALVLHVSDDAAQACPQILRRLSASHPSLRVLRLNASDADPARDPALSAQLLARARPRAVLLLGSSLPPALIAAAAARHLPIILAEARLSAEDHGWGLRASMRRQLLSQIDAVMLPDAASHRIARRIGIEDSRMVMTGPVSEIREPLSCSETERASMAQQMNGRHAWFAACVPPAEEAAVLAAHQAALRRSHRALLIIAPRDAARIDGLARDIEADGLTVARRSEDEDFGDEVQVLLTDGPTEMGLWYRLAPVTFIGGTLSGDDNAMRHPFEPAALGSAIVRGPRPGPFRTEWHQLAGANAARQVRNAEELAQAIADLTQPETIATLASNAWTVSTGGADVALRIADRVAAALDAAARVTA